MGKERRVFTRTSGQVSKYPSPCTKKGDRIIDCFKTHVCPVREGDSVKSQCVYVYTEVFAFHFTCVRLFYVATTQQGALWSFCDTTGYSFLSSWNERS